MNNEHAVANTDVEDDLSTKEEGAQDDLDTLLSEYDTSTKQEAAEDEDVKSRLERLENEISMEKTNQSIEESIGVLKDGLKSSLPDKLLRGYLLVQAEDQRFLSAFQNRHSDPSGWKSVLKAAQKSLQKELGGLPDKAATETRDSLTSAVMGSSKTSSEVNEAVDVTKLSDADFYKFESEAMRS